MLLHDKESLMQLVATAIPDGCRIDIETSRLVAVEVEEDCSARQIVADFLLQVFAHRLEKRVAGCDPFRRRIGLKFLFVEDDLLVFPAEPAEARLQGLAYRP